MNRFFAGLLLTLLTLPLAAQQYNFRTWSVREGMPKPGIYCIHQDSRGYLWFGTQRGGVAKFDGKTFEVVGQSDGLTGRKVRAISEDALGRMWFGTESGISIYDGQNTIPLGDELTAQIESKKIRTLALVDGKMWIGTLGSGLFCWDGDELSNYTTADGIPSNDIRAIEPDEDGVLWIGTDAGLASKDTRSEDPVKSYGITEGVQPRRILSLFADDKNDLWIGTEKGVLHYKEKIFYLYTPGNGLIHPRVRAINQDPEGRIWLGTMAGASRFDGFEFKNFTEENGLSYNRIRDIERDHEGNLWFATYYGGASCFTDEAFTYYDQTNGLLGDVVEAVACDKDGSYYLGTWGGLNILSDNRISKIDTLGGLLSSTVSTLAYDSEADLIYLGYETPGLSTYDGRRVRTVKLPPAFEDKAIEQLIADHFNRLWILADDGTTKVLDKNRLAVLPLSNQFSNLENYHLFEDSRFNIWMGSREEIHCIDSMGKTRQYGTDGELGTGRILAFAEDPSGHIWISGTRGFLARLKDGSWEIFSDAVPQLNSDVSNLIFDNQGFGWATLDLGVFRFPHDEGPSNGRLYLTTDGFRGISALPGAVATDPHGKILFGTLNGLSIFNPAGARANTSPVRIQIVSIGLFGNPVDWSEYSDRPQPWSGFPENLVLPNSKNHLTFSFIGISPGSPESVKYQWKLEGYNSNWQFGDGTQHTINYSNLSSGSYRFVVTASNSTGQYNPVPATFSFEIRPPVWMRWWFILLAVLVISSLLYGLFRLRTASLRRRNRELDEMVQKRTHELKLEKDRAELAREDAERSELVKEQFLANMSHEIRTPMNAIVGMTNLLLDKTPASYQLHYLDAIRQSSDNLLVIINDILDISKIEAGKMDFERTDFSVDKVLQGIYNTLHFKSDEKKIDLIIDKDEKVPEWLIGDPTRLNQILINLVGNAIKFTARGSVTLKCTCPVKDAEKAKLKFEVIDTGIGIPADKMGDIFNTFTQASEDTTRKYGGTGLGLSISRQLVELQGGDIDVESTEGKGSNFYFSIFYPIGKKPVEQDNEIISGQADQLRNKNVLLMEDDAFNQMVAVDTLESLVPDINIKVAENGKKGIEFLEKDDYDIVLMDLNMPELGGYEATKIIRESNKSYSDIPILAMTASVTKAEVDRCFESGMDDYIPKPFESADLVTKMVHLLRKKRTAKSPEI